MSPRRQGPDPPDEARHICGRGSGRQVASDRSAPRFDRRALPFSISIHTHLWIEPADDVRLISR